MSDNNKAAGQPGDGRDALSRKVSGIKANLYSRIRVSVRTMNLIIAALVILLTVAIVVGIATGKR